MGVDVKTRRVFVRVTDSQHSYMMRKAAKYGIPLSRLVLLAVEAYVRAYDGGLGDAQLVVVNYGVWSGVDRHLGGIERALREAVQLLAGTRRALAAGVRSGVLGRADAERAYGTLKEVREDVARLREATERMGRLVDGVCDTAHLVDPYLGPMEGEPLVGEDGGAGAPGVGVPSEGGERDGDADSKGTADASGGR